MGTETCDICKNRVQETDYIKWAGRDAAYQYESVCPDCKSDFYKFKETKDISVLNKLNLKRRGI